MSKINRFDVLKEMSRRNMKIKMFSSGNLKRASMGGKTGWGEVTIAVDNATVQDILQETPLVFGLIIADGQQFEALMAEMEAATEAKDGDE